MNQMEMGLLRFALLFLGILIIFQSVAVFVFEFIRPLIELISMKWQSWLYRKMR